jgi:hypothetical protein
LQTRYFDDLAGNGMFDNSIGRGDVAATDDLSWDGGLRVSEFLVPSEPLQKHEHQQVKRDQSVGHERSRAAVTVFVPYRKKHD